MFSDDDFRAYLNEMSDRIKDTLVIYTDLLNVVDNKVVRNQLLSLMSENAEAFRFLRDKTKTYFENEGDGKK